MELGRITRPHGVRGEVRVQLHWSGSETLEQVDSVLLHRKEQPLGERRVLGARRVDRAVLLRLSGVATREDAEALRGAAVSVPRAALPSLEPGEYYLSDLVGATVVGPEGVVGEVVEIRVHPSVDTLVIRAGDGRLLEQPVAEPWILGVDAEGRRVDLASTDGLF